MGAHHMLASVRALILQSDSSSGEEFVRGLEAELVDLNWKRQNQFQQVQNGRRNTNERQVACIEDKSDSLTILGALFWENIIHCRKNQSLSLQGTRRRIIYCSEPDPSGQTNTDNGPDQPVESQSQSAQQSNSNSVNSNIGGGAMVVGPRCALTYNLVNAIIEQRRMGRGRGVAIL